MRRKQGPRSRATYEGENRIFLTALARTGNVKQAAAETGFWAETMHRRRARDPALAARWDAALETSREALGRAAGARTLPDGTPERRASGQELIVRSAVGGRPQVRRARRGTLTQAAVDCFLAQLSATANVTHAAEVAGFDSSNFYALAQRDQVFAQAWRESLETGYDRLEQGLMQGFLEPARGDWMEEGLAIRMPVTAEQAIHLLNQHRNTVKLQGELADRRRRRPERSSMEFATDRLEKAFAASGCCPTRWATSARPLGLGKLSLLCVGKRDVS